MASVCALLVASRGRCRLGIDRSRCFRESDKGEPDQVQGYRFLSQFVSLGTKVLLTT